MILCMLPFPYPLKIHKVSKCLKVQTKTYILESRLNKRSHVLVESAVKASFKPITYFEC